MPIRPPWRFSPIATAALLAFAGAACADRHTPLGVSPAPASSAPIPESGIRAVSHTWTGATSTDWSVGSNWSGGVVPAILDTAVVPTGVPNFPVLTANTSIGGVTVADLAAVNLGAFDLTASGDVRTGATAGSGIASTSGRLVLTGIARTVQGRLPSVRVAGTYSLNGSYVGRAPLVIQSGRLTVSGQPMTIVP